VLVECDPGRCYPLRDFEKFAEFSPAKHKAEELAKVRLPKSRTLTPAGKPLACVCEGRHDRVGIIGRIEEENEKHTRHSVAEWQQGR
jgi:hypothetical protein